MPSPDAIGPTDASSPLAPSGANRHPHGRKARIRTKQRTRRRMCSRKGQNPPKTRTTVRAVTAYRMRQAAELLAVSDDTVRRWADAGRLATTVGEGGRRVVDGEVLARFAQSLSSKQEPGAIVSESARNRF